jgi:hypothetical protein
LNRLHIKYFLLITLFLAVSQVQRAGTTDSVTQENYLNKSKWEEIAKKTDYTERYKEFKKRNNKPLKIDPNKESKFNTAPWLAQTLKIVLYVIVIGGLAFLLFIVVKNVISNYNESVHDDLIAKIEDLENNLQTENNIDKILEQALAMGEYKLAIRILYLGIIKRLSQAELIEWKREKTNACYVSEMVNHPLGNHFSFLTKIYEKAWFSDYLVDFTRYSVISNHFNNFQTKLN